MNELFRYLHTLIKKNGPVAKEYAELNSWIDKVIRAKREGILGEKDLDSLREIWGEAFSTDTMQGFSFLKPHGYPGDFEIIDRLYINYISPKPSLARWDKFYQNHAAARAVRNRGVYLRKVILARLTDKKSIRVFNVGSGPGRDMQYFFDNDPGDAGSRVAFECLEQDADAIAHCREVCREYLPRISFIKNNILRYTPARRYELVWASGLFDYFNDRIFIRMLKKLRDSLVPGGECVIGNFSVDNPSRNYMEIFEWCLHYRTASQLESLAMQGGIAEKSIKIGRDRTGVNLFLHFSV